MRIIFKNILKKLFLLPLLVVLLLSTFFVVAKAEEENVHTISDASDIIGNNAVIWNTFKNNDVIDLSNLQTTELGKIIIPAEITSLKIKGSADATYTKFNITSENALNLALENVKASSSTGVAAFSLPRDAQSQITVIGINSFTATNNSKCIIGNVTFCGDGDLTIISGKTTFSSNLAHGIYGNVIFDHTGTIKIKSGSGESGTSSSYDGLSAGDAIYGNVECKNTGTIHIEAGDGGSVYFNSSASGSKGGNGGSGINGNLICNGNNTITINAGTGGYLGLRGTYSTAGNAGSGVFGNVIVKNATNITITGGNKRSTDDTDGYGIYGYLKVYNDAVVTVTGGNGALRSSSVGGNGGIGVYGSVTLYNNATVTCSGGNGGNGDSGNSSYPSSFGNGGDGNIAIVGDVYLFDFSSLTANGGNGGKGGNMYMSSSTSTSPTDGTSDGGDGATAITGNVLIENNCKLTVNCADGGNGGRAKTSNGGNAGSGIVGNLTVAPNITLTVSPGDVGTKYYSATTGNEGTVGYGIITTEIPEINGGYINTLFYNSSKQSIAPTNSNGSSLYLTKIVPYVDNELIPNSSVSIVSDDFTYLFTTDRNGEVYCYLPSSGDMKIVYDNYAAPLSQIWEDNETEMFLTLEKTSCSHIAEADDGDCTTAVKCQECGDIMVDAKTTHDFTDDCDTTCNICGTTRTITHKFGAYVYNNDATSSADGTKTRTCSICHIQETVTASGTKWSNPFKDVKSSDYYYSPVLWAVENGITDGWTDTTFAPDMGCTRGQVVTFLWRAAGKPKAKNAQNPFKDVAEGTYYYDAILWAVENKITDGWTDTTFAPDMTCTRGQIVTFIWRAAGEPKAENAENPFKDVASNAYYYDAVLWAVEEKITDGWMPTEFAPDMDCTRGQIVTFLYRYYNLAE